MSVRQTGAEPAILNELPLLARLSREDRQALASKARLRSYAPGSVIFAEGQPGDALHMVVEGLVRIVVSSGSGDEATVAVVGTGDCVGELSLLDGLPRSATAVASNAVKTFVVTREVFVEWLAERPTAALAIMETLSTRLRRTNQAFADMAFLDLAHRLAKQLLALTAIHDVETAMNAGTLRLQVTQGELASMLGVSRESVNKQINQFARQGWLSLSRGAVTINDMAALRALEDSPG